jgi:acetylornithine deacetylase/succinyl-diaminopimelate desuccinylase-like protein
MEKRTRFQEKAIRNYYQNREAIAVQRLQELITELYLSEGKKRERHWKNVATHLQALGVKADQIERLVKQDKPEVVAKLVKTLEEKR